MEPKHLWLKRWVWAGILGLAAVIGIGWLGAFHWTLDLLAHFRLHYTLAAGFLLLMAAAARCRNASIAALGLLMICGLHLFSFFAPTKNGPVDDRRLSLLHANVLTNNPQRQPLLDLIAAENPDVILVQEINQAWVDDLGAALTNYPHRIAVAQENNFGIGIYSRLPLQNPATPSWVHPDFPNVVTDLETPLGLIQLLGLHPPPPKNARTTEMRRQTLEHAAAAIDPELPCIVLGDLNATPWSVDFRRFQTETGLASSHRGHGYQSTWRSKYGWFGIPIDHCLHSPGLVTIQRRIGPDIGSDHRPLTVVLGREE